jgi:hypothetical protein
MGNTNSNSVEVSPHKKETEDGQRFRAGVFRDLHACRNKKRVLDEKRSSIAKAESRTQTWNDLSENVHGLWTDKTGCSCENITDRSKCDGFLPAACWGDGRNSANSRLNQYGSINQWTSRASHLDDREPRFTPAYTVHDKTQANDDQTQVNESLGNGSFSSSMSLRKQMAQQQERWKAQNTDV